MMPLRKTTSEQQDTDIEYGFTFKENSVLTLSPEAFHFLFSQVYLIISVHRTASCSSISLSLYWFLSISTRAISIRVNRRRWVIVMSPSCIGDENWSHERTETWC